LKNKKILPIASATAGNLIWGLSYLFISKALKHAPSPVLLGHRFLLSALVIGLFFLLTGKRIALKGKDWKSLGLMMLTQITYYIFETWGLQKSNTTISGLVLAVVPIVAMGTGALFLKEIPTRRQALLCTLPVLGVILMTVYGNELGALEPIGVVLLLFACLSSALYKTANRKSATDFDPMERTFFILSCSALIFTFSGLQSVSWNLSQYFQPLASGEYVFALLFLSLLCSVAGNLLVNYAAGKMEVVKLTSFGALSTLCTMVTGVLILNEPINLGLLVGSALILIGIHRLAAK